MNACKGIGAGCALKSHGSRLLVVVSRPESAVDAVVVIAVGRVFEGNSVAARSVGQDITTFLVHVKLLPFRPRRVQRQPI